MRNIRLAVLFYFFLFVCIFLLTLNFNYAEGDDAATILYHLCGRNPEIQQPYAAYNSGMDFILQHSGLYSEQELRVFAVSVSFVSGFLILSLLAVLLESLLKTSGMDSGRRKWFYFLLPLLMPDILFHSLVINSSNVSFVFILASLVFFVRYLKHSNQIMLALSVVAFAIGIPFRWTMLIALPLYTGLFLYMHPLQKNPRPIGLLLRIWLANLVGTALALLLIGLTGYDLADIRDTIVSTTGYMEQAETSILSMLASGTAFLTPAVALLLLFAGIRIVRDWENRKTLWPVLGLLGCSVAPFVLLGFYPLYKYSMTLLPALLVLLCYGWDWFWPRRWLRYLFLASVFIPWIIGIHIDASGTFCGPGFALNTDKAELQTNAQGNNPDLRVKILSVKPVFDSGFYLPMPEGPRPLYGYFYVFFGGQWKQQIDIFTQERDRTFDFLAQHPGALYFQDYKTYFLCDLYRRSYTTATAFIPDSHGASRVFTKGSDSITVRLVPESSKVQWMQAFFKTAPQPVVYRSAYSNDILRLQLENTGNINILGPFTAIKP